VNVPDLLLNAPKRNYSLKEENLNRDTLKICAEDEDSLQDKEEFDGDFGSLLADCDDFYPGGK